MFYFLLKVSLYGDLWGDGGIGLGIEWLGGKGILYKVSYSSIVMFLWDFGFL